MIASLLKFINYNMHRNTTVVLKLRVSELVFNQNNIDIFYHIDLFFWNCLFWVLYIDQKNKKKYCSISRKGCLIDGVVLVIMMLLMRTFNCPI